MWKHWNVSFLVVLLCPAEVLQSELWTHYYSECNCAGERRCDPAASSRTLNYAWNKNKYKSHAYLLFQKKKLHHIIPRPGLMAVRRGFLSLICSCLLSSASLCWLRFFNSLLDGKNRPTVCVCASAHMRKPAAGGTVEDSGVGTACQVVEDCMRKSEREDDVTLYVFMSTKQTVCCTWSASCTSCPWFTCEGVLGGPSRKTPQLPQ